MEVVYFDKFDKLKHTNGFAETNYRRFVKGDKRLLFSELTEKWGYMKGDKLLRGITSLKGFKGKANLDFFLEHYGRTGSEALNDLIEKHVLFFIDPGKTITI